MAFTHTINFSWSNGSGTLNSSLGQTSETEYNMDVVCVKGVEGVPHVTPIILGLDVTQVKSLYIISNKALSLSFTTSGAPIVIALAANAPLVWIVGNGYVNPLTSDITGLNVSNSSITDDATLKMRYLIDTTI